jgi:N-glycosylase/DNA lyase
MMVNELKKCFGILKVPSGKYTLSQENKILEISSLYSFPTIASLCEPGMEESLRAKGFGYRAKYISRTAGELYQRGGAEWLSTLNALEYADALEMLQQFPGIGRKVADCSTTVSRNSNPY